MGCLLVTCGQQNICLTIHTPNHEKIEEMLGEYTKIIYLEPAVVLVGVDGREMVDLPSWQTVYVEDMNHQIHVVYGGFVICGYDAESNQYEPLTREQLRFYKSMYGGPEAADN